MTGLCRGWFYGPAKDHGVIFRKAGRAVLIDVESLKRAVDRLPVT